MLPQLTSYFLQFHQVHIPSIGTIRLVQQPASLDVAAKVISPPHFVMRFTEDGWLTKHQLWYCGSQLQQDEEITRQSLEETGAALKKTIEQQPFVWKGIGTLSYAQEKLQFEPYMHETFLQPVSAERVLRQHVQHSVLVGDQVVLSDGQGAVAEQEQERHWNWSQIAGWSIVILALCFILFFFYQHQFNVMASGLRRTMDTPPPAATYVQ